MPTPINLELKLGPRTFRFACERIEQGVAINPVLPADFDRKNNHHRPGRHLAWWNVPYILEQTHRGETIYVLRCLNGGSWDRSTWCGLFFSLEEALGQVKNATIGYGEAARARSHQLQAGRKAQQDSATTASETPPPTGAQDK